MTIQVKDVTFESTIMVWCKRNILLLSNFCAV